MIIESFILLEEISIKDYTLKFSKQDAIHGIYRNKFTFLFEFFPFFVKKPVKIQAY